MSVLALTLAFAGGLILGALASAGALLGRPRARAAGSALLEGDRLAQGELEAAADELRQARSTRLRNARAEAREGARALLRAGVMGSQAPRRPRRVMRQGGSAE